MQGKDRQGGTAHNACTIQRRKTHSPIAEKLLPFLFLLSAPYSLHEGLGDSPLRSCVGRDCSSGSSPPLGSSSQGTRHVFFSSPGGGISSYAKEPSGAGNSLKLCLNQALKDVPKEKHSVTPLYLGATAGMRLLK